MKRASFVIDRDREDAHPLHRAVIDTDGLSRAAVLLWDGRRATPITLSWCDAPKSTVASVLDDLPLVKSHALSAGRDGTYAFVWQRSFQLEPSLMALVSDAAALPMAPVVFDADGSVAITLVGTHAALRDLVAEFGDRIDYTVTELTDYDGSRPVAGLTSRQRDALAAAVAVGFYDVPRTGTIADVAARLDCAESTASELVRKAQARVVRASIRRTAPGSCSGRC
ncbi:helix-turn-helix domain-containing protein [Halorientalis brevis]|uniref:Helix-turn-helix domain-containing protein n=1 Tax=Halorientalis brevis TaxID=1126241 RepID=A0ABD6CH91_9EURY